MRWLWNNRPIEVDLQSDSDDDIALSVIAKKIMANKTPAQNKREVLTVTKSVTDEPVFTQRKLYISNDQKSFQEIRPMPIVHRISKTWKKKFAHSNPVKNSLEIKKKLKSWEGEI